MSRTNAGTNLALPPRPKGATVERRVRIDAPADAVWEVLADVEGWGRWNPIYPSARGSIGPGDTITLTIALPGMKPRISSATVLHALPPLALQFGAPAFAGLLHATRYIEIDPLTDRSCTLVNGETFGRLLGRALVALIGTRVGDGLRGQNEGLKASAESRWRAVNCESGV